MKYFYIISILITLIGCNKPNIMSDLEFHKYLLAGSGNYHNTEHTWALDSLVVGGKNFPLSAVQKSYKKTFKYDGTYADTDGFIGKWDMSTVNDLQVNILPSTKQVYKVIDINSIRFSYSITTSSTTFEYYYKIIYE